MVDNSTIAKIDAFLMELQEEGITEIIFACTNDDNMLGMKFVGNPKILVYLTSMLELHILDNSSSIVVEDDFSIDAENGELNGREDYGE